MDLPGEGVSPQTALPVLADPPPLSEPTQPPQQPDCGRREEERRWKGHESSGDESKGSSDDEDTPLRLGRLLYRRGLLSKAGELTLRARLTAARSERSSTSLSRDEDLRDGCANPGCAAAQQLPGACGCGEVFYCSVECAGVHWREHRKRCCLAVRLSLLEADGSEAPSEAAETGK